jgi:hypothetical protein
MVGHTNVPLAPEMVYVPTVFYNGEVTVDGDFMRHVDLLPTIASLISQSVDGSRPGYDLTEGAPENRIFNADKRRGGHVYSAWDGAGPEAYTYNGRDRVSIDEPSVLEPCPEHLAEPGHIVRSEAERDIWIGTGDGILVVSRISINDGKSISPGEVFQSIRDRFGMNLQKQVCGLNERITEIEDQLDEK